MKRGALKKVVDDYESLFPGDWQRVGSRFMRRVANWVQIIGFEPSRFDDSYAPRCSFEFLDMPGPPTAGFLSQEFVHSKNAAQRWVSLIEHRESLSTLFSEMLRQFKPEIDAPFGVEDVKKLLQKDIEYWPHCYALCVLAAEERDSHESMRYFRIFSDQLADKQFDWVAERRAELKEILDRLLSPSTLQSHLLPIRKQKLEDLKLKSDEPVD